MSVMVTVRNDSKHVSFMLVDQEPKPDATFFEGKNKRRQAMLDCRLSLFALMNHPES